MTVSQVAKYSRHDPVVNTFRTVGQLHHLASSGEVAVMPETRFAEALVAKAAKMASDLLLVPCSETGAMPDAQVLTASASVDNKMAASYASFVRSVLDVGDRSVAVFSRTRPSDPDATAAARKAASERPKLARACRLQALPHLPALLWPRRRRPPCPAPRPLAV